LASVKANDGRLLSSVQLYARADAPALADSTSKSEIRMTAVRIDASQP
jgi:hypothetical protein